MMSMPLLLLCYFISVPPWPGEAKANLTMGSGSDSDLGVAAEPNALAVAAAVVPAVERKGGKKVKDEQRDEKQLCWLCNVEIQGSCDLQRSHGGWRLQECHQVPLQHD